MNFSVTIQEALEQTGHTPPAAWRWVCHTACWRKRQRRMAALEAWAELVVTGQVVPPMHDVTKHFAQRR